MKYVSYLFELERTASVPNAKKVLIVDDEASVRRLTARMLKSLAYETIEAEGPSEAMTTCNEHGSEIDLIITDFNMPELSGTEMMEKIREDLPQMKVIYVSGFDMDTVSTNAPSAADTFLQKPYSRDTLKDLVEKILFAPVDEEEEKKDD